MKKRRKQPVRRRAGPVDAPDPAQRRKRRLSFNEEVLVAEYIKGSSGISPARATVPLVEMERRARARAVEEAAAEQQQQAIINAFEAQQAPPKKKPRASASAAADRIAALIAGEEDATAVGATSGRARTEPTDQDGDAVLERRGAPTPMKPREQTASSPAAAAPAAGGKHAQVRAALGGLTTRLADARRLLLRGARTIEVAQALHASMGKVPWAKCHRWRCPSSALAPPQGALGVPCSSARPG